MVIKVTFDNGVFRPVDPQDVRQVQQGSEFRLDLSEAPPAEAEGAPEDDGGTGDPHGLVEFLNQISTMPAEPTARTDEPYGPVSRNVDAYLYGDEFFNRKMGRTAEPK